MGYVFPKLSIQQAGERLKQSVIGNPGPKDHLRVAEACITSSTLEEALEKVAPLTEYQIDVDDAAAHIRKALAGYLPLSIFEAEALIKAD